MPLKKLRGIFSSGTTKNWTCYLSGCISLNSHSAKDLIYRYCSTDFLQCFASFLWVIFLSMCKGNRIHGKEQLFSVFIFRKQLIWSSPFLFRIVTVVWLMKKILCWPVYLYPTLSLPRYSYIEITLYYL